MGSMQGACDSISTATFLATEHGSIQLFALKDYAKVQDEEQKVLIQ